VALYERLAKPWHDLAMSDLERRSGSRPTRRKREQRAYNLVLVGGVAGLVFVVTALLAIITSFSWSIPVLAAIVAVLCAVLFRRTVR
jgi:fatty acid desaturase